jgi:hypothetical protein
MIDPKTSLYEVASESVQRRHFFQNPEGIRVRCCRIEIGPQPSSSVSLQGSVRQRFEECGILDIAKSRELFEDTISWNCQFWLTKRVDVHDEANLLVRFHALDELC